MTTTTQPDTRPISPGAALAAARRTGPGSCALPGCPNSWHAGLLQKRYCCRSHATLAAQRAARLTTTTPQE